MKNPDFLFHSFINTILISSHSVIWINYLPREIWVRSVPVAGTECRRTFHVTLIKSSLPAPITQILKARGVLPSSGRLGEGSGRTTNSLIYESKDRQSQRKLARINSSSRASRTVDWRLLALNKPAFWAPFKFPHKQPVAGASLKHTWTWVRLLMD